MSKQCVVCSQDLKIVPAGTSKASGKPYPAFYACPNKCDLRGKMDTRVDAPPPGFSKPGMGSGGTQVSQDFVDVMTSINAKVDKILNMLQKEMPEEDMSNY